jgi:hypothetical protein
MQELLAGQIEPALRRKEGISIALSNAAIAEQCLLELSAYHRGELYNQVYGLELLRRATTEGDLEAREWVQRCFSEIVRIWLRRHPKRATACSLESEEYFIALTFERFWQATALTRQVPFIRTSEEMRFTKRSGIKYGT